MEIVAVIPALTEAAVRPFAGRRLAEHALAAARQARQVSRVVVWTRDDALTAAAASLGADVIMPAAATAEPARLLADCLRELSERDGLAPSLALLLDPLHPLVTAPEIEAAIEHQLRCGADTLVTVAAIDAPLWIEHDGGLAEQLPGSGAARTLVESSAIIGVRAGVFVQTQALPAGRTVLFELPPIAALRLDRGLDWTSGEAVFRARGATAARALLRHVRLLVFDFDGVMTDNRVVVFEDGREAVLCNRSDGLGLERLRASGLPMAVISKEVNPVVAARCRKLKLPCEQGINDKLAVLQRLAAERGVALTETAFVGNDLNDLACLTAVGVPIAPADAYPEVLRVCSIVTAAPGGAGAVREICDGILAARCAPPD
jgi:N-acylneuraminate cytidylyltransferase